MATTRRRLAIAVVIACCADGDARASDAAISIGPPTEAAAIVLEELGRLAVISEASALAERASGLGSPARRLDEAGIRAAVAELDLGYQAWIAGESTRAVELLRAARKRIARAPISVLGEPQLRRALFRAGIVLALAAKRAGDDATAIEEMTDLARSHPDHAPTRQSFGPTAEELFRAASDALRSRGRGALVAAPGSGAKIFVNERYLGSDRVEIELSAGTYRVYAHYPMGPGRLRVVEVRPGSRTVLDIEPWTDRFVRSSVRWFGVTGPAALPPRTARAALARGLRADRLIIVGASGDAVTLWRCDRSGSVEYTASARRTSHTELLQLARDAVRSSPDSAAPQAASVWKPLTLLGASAVVAGAGITLLQLDGNSRCADGAQTCDRIYETATAGWVATGAGVLGMVAATAWLLWPPGSRASTSARLAPGISGLVVIGAF